MPNKSPGAPSDPLDDLNFPKLQELLAHYVGALKLREIGSVDDRFVSQRLRRLLAACRAADRIIEVMSAPPAAMARAIRSRVLRPHGN